MSLEDTVKSELFSLQDENYRQFQTKLIPNVPPDTIIGVRTPELRNIAKQLVKQNEAQSFMRRLPHRYFEENQIHAFIISGIKDYDECIEALLEFLPFVDNWATCDQMSPAVFKRHHRELAGQIKLWLGSGDTYTVRFGLGMLMRHFLDEDFDPAYLETAAGVRSDEYYVNMMTAWYFATALAKQYDSALPYIQDRRLEPWTHNKTIQKATESYRISSEQKEYLRGLKINTENTK